MGFREAIGISTALVIAYIGLNIYVLTVGGQKIMANPALLSNWQLQLNTQYLNPLAMVQRQHWSSQNWLLAYLASKPVCQ
jgi:hypothetical protein